MNLAERAAKDLHFVAEYWPALAALRFPDATMPFIRPVITPERRAELDHEARIERTERTDLSPGEHIDAVRPEILDLMSDLLIDAEDLAARVAGYAHVVHLPPPSTAFADPGPYLRLAAGSIGELPEEVLDHVASTARRMVASISRTLGLVYDGQQLQVVCPWCDGGLSGRPSWRVRMLPGDLVAIVCESGVCEPPSKDVGTWFRGAPAWPLWDWEFLAKRVDGAERMTAS